MTTIDLIKDGQLLAAYAQATKRPDWADGLIMIPPYMREGLVMYICLGRGTGGFLNSLLSNDLMGAMSRADSTNLHSLPAYGGFLHNFAPPDCYGSPEAVKAWIEKGGLEGRPS